MIKRYYFLAIGIALAFLWLLEQTHAADPANIILINFDDADAELLGEDALRRFFPNMRRLRREGMRMSNFHVTTPLCGPSRMALLSARYGHHTGYRTNLGGEDKSRGFNGGFRYAVENRLLDEEMGVWIKRAGYRTMFVGKFLNNDYVTHLPKGWTDYCSSRLPSYYGIRQFHNLDSRLGTEDARPKEEYRVDSEWSVIAELIDRHNNRADTKPFFLYYAPFAPHRQGFGIETPMAEPRFANFAKSAKQPLTASYNEKQMSDKPSHYQVLPRLDAEARRDVAELYRNRIRAVKSVDLMIGRLIKRLEATGQIDNTFIVVTSDNGYVLGQHRMTAKMVPFDRVTRVPFLVWGPGVPANSTCDQLLGHIDIAPTLVELAGGKVRGPIDGQSFAPLCFDPDSKERSWRSALIVENWSTKNNLGVSIPTTYASLRLADEVYTEWSNGEAEYYELSNDPNQLHNRVTKLSSEEAGLFSLLLKTERRANDRDYLNLEDRPTTTVGRKFELKGVAEALDGVRHVRLRIKSLDRNQFWDGTRWTDKRQYVPANLAAPDSVVSDWQYTFRSNLTADKTSRLRITFFGETVEGSSIDVFSKSFDYDGKPPTAKLLAPSNDDVLTAGRQVFRLLAQDNQSIDRVRFQLYSYDRERYWNGKNWQPSPTSVSGKGLANDRWTYALELGSGNYRVRGWSLDKAGNRSAKSGVADFQVVN